MEKKRPSIGVSIILIKETQILLGLRVGSHGAQTWGMPGGHLEWNEDFFDCAKREAIEELGVNIICRETPIFATNDYFLKEDKHYVTVFVVAVIAHGEVSNMEPSKCEKWSWHNFDNLPKNLFLPVENLLKQNVLGQLFHS